MEFAADAFQNQLPNPQGSVYTEGSHRITGGDTYASEADLLNVALFGMATAE